jgi:hypothetical protein
MALIRQIAEESPISYGVLRQAVNESCENCADLIRAKIRSVIQELRIHFYERLACVGMNQ